MIPAVAPIRSGVSRPAVRPVATFVLAMLACGLPALARAYPTNFMDATYITSGLQQPIALAWSSDGRLFIGQRTGAVKIWNGTALSTALTLSVQNFEEQGLLGLALHPDFPTQPYAYVLYTPGSNPQTDSFHRISRFTFNPVNSTLGNELVLHSALPTGRGYHVAGCIRTTASGFLYATDGENGYGTGLNYPQDLTRLEGKMIRLNLDGTIPQSNPFVGTPGARTEIYHRGFRNPFRFAIQPSTGQPFICDVGSTQWEEIDTGPPGLNFGWSTYEGTITPQPPGITNPLYAYATSGNASITGCVFYTGPGFPAGYTGNFFFLDHSRGRLGRMVLDASNNVVSVNESWGLTSSSGWNFGPVDLTQGPDGALYYTDWGNNSVRRVSYTSSVGVEPVDEASGLSLTAAPNPFHVTTRLRWSLRREGMARVQIFDLSGRHVRTLASGSLPAGEHGFTWNGEDEQGRALAAGVYLARLRTDDEIVSARLFLAR